MAKKLRCGAIGIGGIWRFAHASALTANPDVEVVALCDIDRKKAQAYADEHGNIAHVFEDYRDLLKLDLDFVDICTPNVWHSTMAVDALKKGLHVFCEKPDAVSVAEAKKMQSAAEKSGKTLMVMRNNRFRWDARYLHRYITEGHMGEIYTGRCGWIRRRGIPGRGGWFTTKALSGGGPLIDLGVHIIDMTMWLMGSPTPVAVTGCTYRKFADAPAISDSIHSSFGEAQAEGTFDVEDLATGFIRFENGASLQIEFSWASNIEREMNFSELRGTKAGARIGMGDLAIFTEQAGGLVDLNPKGPRKEPSHHGMNLQHFVDVLQKRAKPIFTPEQGVNMIKILEAMYKSAESGKEVRVG